LSEKVSILCGVSTGDPGAKVPPSITTFYSAVAKSFVILNIE